MIAGLRFGFKKLKGALPGVRDRMENRAWQRRSARNGKKDTKGTVRTDGRS
jgi:hypothetical protein